MSSMSVQSLFVIAGPRGVGKSSFIERCDELIAIEERPPALAPLFDARTPLIQMKGLRKRRDKSFGVVKLHVDLFTPFETLQPQRAEDLKKSLSVRAFQDYSHLDSCLIKAEQLFVVTLQASRRTILTRWLDRAVRKEDRQVRTNLARIYSDATGDDLLNHLYETWYQFLEHANPQGHWIANVEERDIARLTPKTLPPARGGSMPML